MTQIKSCPNCAGADVHNHPENGCVLAVLIQVVRERGNLTEEQITQLHTNCDADSLWSAIGPVVDALEAGQFSAVVQPGGLEMADTTLRPITVTGSVKSISDDDLCATCKNCNYQPGEMSACSLNWPGQEDADGYVQQCTEFLAV